MAFLRVRIGLLRVWMGYYPDPKGLFLGYCVLWKFKPLGSVGYILYLCEKIIGFNPRGESVIIAAMLNVLFGLIGLLVGGLLNVLADDLPRRERPSAPHCPNPECDHVYGPAGWLALGRRLQGGGRCPACGQMPRRRWAWVEGGTAVLFACLPWLIDTPITLAVYALFIAVLILIIIIDLENRLILDVVTLPMTLLALLFSLVLPGINFISALLGAVLGLALFLMIYGVAKVTFGPGAIGQGDIKLAMLMGAMLGVPHILIALMMGIFLGGIISAVLLGARLVTRDAYLPYGQYLAIAAIVMLLWGQAITDWLLA